MERIKFNLDIPDDIRKIHKIFNDNGFKLFIVGGSIRDALLDKLPKDWDLATDAIPDKVESMMKEAGLITIATGKAFGVINVFTETDEFEIATFRSDQYNENSSTIEIPKVDDAPYLEFIGKVIDGEFIKGDNTKKNISGHRPDGVKFTTIEIDVLRRDLTINALFFDLDTSEVVDLVGGVEDLKNGIIRTVGQAKDRFCEDRLRILRAIRFAARFSNGLHSEIIDALREDSSLEGISSERIRDEFLKGLKSANSTVFFLEMLDSFNLFDWIFPSMEINRKVIEDKDPIVAISMLLKNNDLNKLKKDLNKLSYSTTEIKSILFLITLPSLSIDNAVDMKKAFLISNVSVDQLRNYGSRECVLSQLLDAFEEFQLTISGEDIMKKFDLKPGKELGDKIKELELDNFKKLIYL